HPVGLYGAPRQPSASDVEAAADQDSESCCGEPTGAKTHSSKQRMSERLHCRSFAGDLRSKGKRVHAAAATVSSTQVGRDAEMFIEIAGHGCIPSVQVRGAIRSRVLVSAEDVYFLL